MTTTVLKRSTATKRKRSEQVLAQPSVDSKFLALLRRKCGRAAMVGALTAAAEAIPGLSRALSFVFGELIDAKFLAVAQRELIEETFALYGLELPTALQSALVNKVQFVGTTASVASDALVRRLIRRALGSIGGAIAMRFVPIAAIVSSALSNATVTYAIGKRAQAVAKLRDAPIKGMPDVLRAFSGVDERRVYSWTMEAVESALGSIGAAIKRIRLPRPAWLGGKSKAKKKRAPRKPR